MKKEIHLTVNGKLYRAYGYPNVLQDQHPLIEVWIPERMNKGGRISHGHFRRLPAGKRRDEITHQAHMLEQLRLNSKGE